MKYLRRRYLEMIRDLFPSLGIKDQDINKKIGIEEEIVADFKSLMTNRVLTTEVGLDDSSNFSALATLKKIKKSDTVAQQKTQSFDLDGENSILRSFDA